MPPADNNTNTPNPMQPGAGMPPADPTVGGGAPVATPPAPIDQPAQVNPEPSAPVVETPVVTGETPVATPVPTEGSDAPGGSTPPPAPTV